MARTKNPDATLSDGEIASIALLEMLHRATTPPVDYVDTLDLPPKKRERVLKQLKTLAERAMRPHLRKLNERGHDVSGYRVEF